MSNVKDTIKEIVQEVMDIDINDFEDSQVIAEISEWDSFNNLMLIAKFEEDLNIEFSASDVEELIILSDLYVFIESKLN
jgi:acyl carrier protein